MPIYKKINKNFFKKWSYEMAYVLGFIYADGNIIKTKRNTWFLSIQITDRVILEKIKKEIGSSHKILKKTSFNIKHKDLYRLQIGSKEICEDLILLGLSPKKSKIMEMPFIPELFFPDFLRGYFDGDGGVWVGSRNKTKQSKTLSINTYFTSGSIDFLISLKNRLTSLGLKGGFLVKKQRGFDLKYSITDSLQIYKIMYNRSSLLFLNRKKTKFEKYIRSRSSTG